MSHHHRFLYILSVVGPDYRIKHSRGLEWLALVSNMACSLTMGELAWVSEKHMDIAVLQFLDYFSATGSPIIPDWMRHQPFNMDYHP